jgi:hypothetical protein
LSDSAAQDVMVTGIPALLLFRDGHVVARTAGASNVQRLVGWAGSNLANVA